MGGAALGNMIPLPMMVGTLTIDVPLGTIPGIYNIVVDNAAEANKVSKIKVSTTQVIDPLSGVGPVSVIPEPATLALLGLGGLVALRRRRTA